MSFQTVLYSSLMFNYYLIINVRVGITFHECLACQSIPIY